MKENKILILVLIIFAIFGIIGLYFYFNNISNEVVVNNTGNSINNSLHNQNTNVIKNNTNNNTIANVTAKDYYLVVGDYLNVSFNNKSKKWRKVNKQKYTDEFEVYVDKSYFGKYSLIYGKVWNLLDSNNNYVDFDGSIIAYSPNFNVNVLNYQELNINDDIIGEVKKYLIDYNYQYKDTYFNHLYYINENNYVVFCTNISYNDVDKEDINYTVGYLKKDGLIYTIFNNKFDSESSIEQPVNALTGWLIVNGKTYLSINEIYYSNKQPTASLYEFNGSKFTKVI